MHCRTASALLFFLAACSTEPGGSILPPPPPPPAPPPAPPPPTPDRVVFDSLPLGFRVRAGDSVQLVAKVLDGWGKPIPGAPITWESGSASASVSADGLVRFRADTVLGSHGYSIRAVSGPLSTGVVVYANDWTLTAKSLLQGQNPVTLVAWLESTDYGKQRIEVSVLCGEGDENDTWAASVLLGPIYDWDFGGFGYRFDAAAPMGDDWYANWESDFVAAPSSELAEQFFDAVTTADSLHLTYSDIWQVHSISWDLRGSAVVADRLRAACD